MVCYPRCAANLFWPVRKLPRNFPSTEKTVESGSPWVWDIDPSPRDGLERRVQEQACAETGVESKGREGSLRSAALIVTTMSGRTIVELPVVTGEVAAALKRRIQQKEGTVPQMQKLVQHGRVLADADVLSVDPVVLVRIERKRAIVASTHSDLRFYDIETGEAMRSAPSLNLRMSCVAADWPQLRCITGSQDGVIRIWDIPSGECIQTLHGHSGPVHAICVGSDNRFLTAAQDGVLKMWALYSESPTHPYLQTPARGKFLVSTDWSRMVALVVAEGLTGTTPAQQDIVAYNLVSRVQLWSYQFDFGPVPALAADWNAQEGILAAPGTSSGAFFKLRLMEGLAPDEDRLLSSFGPRKIHPKGLMRISWEDSRVMVVVEPFGLELWCLATLERLHAISDPSGDVSGNEIISLDVDWTSSVPRAVTCRTYIDWDLVVGEVCIQHWDFRTCGGCRNVVADHPMVGGFDIVAAMAQL